MAGVRSAGAGEPAPAAPPVAPDFSRLDLDQREVHLAAYRGKVVLLNFWATWCAPCLSEVPRFAQWQRKYGGRGLQIIGVSMDDDEAPVRAACRKYALNYPVVMGDEKLGELYGGVLGLPMTFLIDGKGRIRFTHESTINLDVLEREIRELLPRLPEPAGPVRPIGSLDLERYAGRWHEVARLPNRFQRRCVADVTADYELRDGGLTVVNECETADGRRIRAEGRARLADASQPDARLEVRFAPALLSFLPFVWADYWVLDLTDDYGAALVGTPDRRFLWVLSRRPELDEATYDRLVDTAARQGFDVTRLQRTRPR